MFNEAPRRKQRGIGWKYFVASHEVFKSFIRLRRDKNAFKSKTYMNERVILVNEKDQLIGDMDKLEVHQKGLLHRAFSAFIFNDKEELLLQCRAKEKYHSANLWTNTCCSHPRPGELTLEAAQRRLKEEMGIETNLEKKFDFIYQAKLDNNLIEYEFDHVYIGKYNRPPLLNPEEASDYSWISVRKLKNEIRIYPRKYTEWLKIAIHYF